MFLSLFIFPSSFFGLGVTFGVDFYDLDLEIDFETEVILLVVLDDEDPELSLLVDESSFTGIFFIDLTYDYNFCCFNLIKVDSFESLIFSSTIPNDLFIFS